jgi:hypothetical protein
MLYLQLVLQLRWQWLEHPKWILQKCMRKSVKGVISMHDFFSTGTTNYKRGWKENNFSALKWLKIMKKD